MAERAQPEARPAAGRPHWEVLAAVTVLAIVLLVIDALALGQPSLLLSFAPLAFLVFAALFKLTPERISAWLAAFGGLALTSGDARYAGLAYPVVALAIALFLSSLARRTGAGR